MKTAPNPPLALPLFVMLLFVMLANPFGLAPVSAQGADPVRPAAEVEDVIPVAGVLADDAAEEDQALTAQIAELMEAGSHSGAIDASRKQLAVRLEALGEDDPLTIEAMQILGTLLIDHAGDYAAAEPLLRQALAGWERLLDPRHPRRLAALDALGWALKNRGKPEESEQLLREALAGRRLVFGNDDENTLNTVHHLGSLLNYSGRLAEAEPYYREAYETSLRVYGEDYPATMSFQNNMGYLLDNLGRFPEAESMYRQVLKNRRRVLGEDHINTVNTMNNLGGLLIQSSAYEESQALLEKALASYRRLLGDEHSSTLRALNNLGLVLKQQGLFAEAEAYMREAVATNRKTLGNDHRQTLTTINNLAGLLKAQGRMAESEALFLEALEGDRRILGDSHPNTLSTMHNLTRLLEAQGRLDEAEDLLRLTVRAREKTLGPEHPDTLRSTDNLGMLLYYLRRYGEAEQYLRQAFQVRTRILEEGHPELFDSAGNLGKVLHARQEFGEAERLYRQSLDGYERTLGPDNPRTLVALSNMGHLHRSRGEFDKAEAAYRQTLEGRRRVLGRNHPDVVKSLNALALVKGDTGEFQAAEALWQESAEVFELARLQSSASGLERAYFAERISPLGQLAACRARNGKAGLAWVAFEEDQARGLLDAISARYARPLTSAERGRETDLIGQLSRNGEQFSALRTDTDTDERQFDTLREEQTRLQADLARFEAELAVRYGPTAGEVFDLGRIQGALPERAALVGWVDVAAEPHAANPDGEHWACVVRRRGTPVWVRLPGSGADGAWTEEDSELAGQVRQVLGRAQRRSAARRNQALLQRLMAQRIEPLRPHLEGVEQLVILPAGAMSGIPLEALDQSYTVSYAPSGTMYAWLREKRGPTSSPPSGEPPLLLALGDPDFGSGPDTLPSAAEPPDHGVLVAMVMDGSNAYRGGVREGDVMLTYGGDRLGGAADLGPAVRKAAETMTSDETGGDPPIVPITVWRDGETCRLELSPGRLGLRPAQEAMPDALITQREMDAVLGPTRDKLFERLPGSRREVEAIAGLFLRAGEESGNEILLGEAASEQRLDALSAAGKLKQFGVIHLATHGVMNDRIALQSALILARERDRSEGDAAGSEAGLYDGRLTGEQIVRTWDLDADLVTLSGCETALGRQTGGEGYLGFSQAMFIAGARSLLLSLWKVNDQATMLLMTRFYENVLGKFPVVRSVGGRHYDPGQGLSRALALQEAKQWLAGVTGEALRVMGAGLAGAERGADGDAAAGDAGAPRPFADPHFWAAFVLLGDPG